MPPGIAPPGSIQFEAPELVELGHCLAQAAAGQAVVQLPAEFGALRAAEIAHNPSIWDIDVNSGGKVCVNNASTVQLWRADSEAATTVQIRSADGKSQELSWAAGDAMTSWPAAVPIKNGTSYQIEWPGTGERSSLDVVTVANPPADLVGAAQVLIENGCQKQLDLLVESAGKGK
jgi:hypothetical protein